MSAGGDTEPLHIKLSGGYPHAQLDRLLRQLEPVLGITTPTTFRLDLTGLVHFCPTTQAVVAAVFHRIIAEGLSGPGSTIVLPAARGVQQYLMRMDFFKPLVGHLEETFERRPPRGFRPLQHFDATSCYAAGTELRDAIMEACEIEDGLVAGAVHLCLGELAENVIFHAEASGGGFAAAQGWKKKAAVEVAIVDMGRGVRASLTSNPEYADIQTDMEAIEKALEPMVSGIPDTNRGLGLAVTKFLLQRNGGQLMVRSGEGAVYAGSQERSEMCAPAFPGTIVSLTARTDRPLDAKAAWDDITRAGYPLDDDS